MYVCSLQSYHAACDADDDKLRLLQLWENSLYEEFLRSKATNATSLSSSMRYKLRKKNPCPIELEQELRVKNARLPKDVHDGLNEWLKRHRDHPYPSKADKDGLSSRLGITPQQVRKKDRKISAFLPTTLFLQWDHRTHVGWLVSLVGSAGFSDRLFSLAVSESDPFVGDGDAVRRHRHWRALKSLT